jgi:hypothetical protein
LSQQFTGGQSLATTAHFKMAIEEATALLFFCTAEYSSHDISQIAVQHSTSTMSSVLGACKVLLLSEETEEWW